MLTKNFYFDLPENLIAQHPSKTRGDDKLMQVNRKTGIISHYTMNDLPSLLREGTVMVFNNSKVRPSRCFATKRGTDKKVEFLFINEHTVQTENSASQKKCWQAMVKNAKKQRVGDEFIFDDNTIGVIEQNKENQKTELRLLSFYTQINNKKIPFILTESWFEKNGHIPLPPYIKRSDTKTDAQRYQNIYASEIGSAACPTAGLHFTEQLFEKLAKKNITRTNLTLHVGLGTFLPVRTEKIEDHIMHTESYTITEETANLINTAKKEKRPVLAVGTTALRSLEAAWNGHEIVSGSNATDIFLYPGCNFNVVDQLFTNFHTPESTLLMLVSAFATKDTIFSAYKTAIEHQYRFFSYGDAMLIQ